MERTKRPLLINAIQLVGTGIGNELSVTYEDDSYRRHFVIWPEDDTYLDWATYPQGGYPVEVSVTKNLYSNEDDWDMDAIAEIEAYDTSTGMWFLKDTNDADLDLHLDEYRSN